MMTGLESVAYAGNHGMTLWINGVYVTPAAVVRYVGLAAEVAKELAEIDAAGVTVEHTGPNVAVHYRRARDERAARAKIKDAIAASKHARSFRVQEGRKVFELRPQLPIDKGTALEEMVKRLGTGALVCVGDDRTDVDMFRAARGLRDSGVGAATVAVRSEEMVPELLEVADYTLDDVEGVEEFLAELVKALGETAP